jgi:vesicle-fusing ATPase
MGPCALLEVLVLPQGLSVTRNEEDNDMLLEHFPWNPMDMFDTALDVEEDIVTNNSTDAHDIDLTLSIQQKVGGLSPQIEAIVRRVLDGRMIQTDDALKESQTLLDLGLSPIKGLLLYGKPGTGKTLLAREIAHHLHSRPPKIVSAPELLDRWVGGSEKLVRALFRDAELELQQCGGNILISALHVIVIDEIDAVFRKRSSATDSGEVTRASVVNQILSKLDGLQSPGNVLVIGMTNRRELLDEALLRPGRLEVQIEIPLPDQEARREILSIHLQSLRAKGRLSQPLCQNINRLAAKTRGFSGADLAGLVRSAGSIALARARCTGDGVEGLLITLSDMEEALKELKPR